MDNSQNWYGIRATGNYIGDGWIPPTGPGLATTKPPPPPNVLNPELLPGSVFDARTYRDSITNHDLITK
ncbi:MAG: hypothetical protein FJ275_08990 [Planctomycetes bacterium]|nr:hypothetical protein [Planctomycetota bacterium]